MDRITIATCCFEKDYKIVMQNDWLKTLFSKFNYDFFEKILVINMEATEEVKQLSDALLSNNAVDNVFYCGQYMDAVKTTFGIHSFIYKHRFNAFSVLHDRGVLATLRYVYQFWFSSKGNCI